MVDVINGAVGFLLIVFLVTLETSYCVEGFVKKSTIFCEFSAFFTLAKMYNENSELRETLYEYFKNISFDKEKKLYKYNYKDREIIFKKLTNTNV